MRKVLVFVLMFMFLANTAIVSAWAKLCMHDVSASVSDTEIASQNGTPPCHQTENTKQSGNQNQHCVGLCLCAPISNNMSILMKNGDVDGIWLPVTIKKLFVIDEDTLTSVSQMPAKHPPKHIS